MRVKNHILRITGAVLIAGNAFAQFTHTNLRCVGNVPEDILKSTRQKIVDDVGAEISINDSKKERQVKIDFLFKSNYMLDELLLSGKVVYGNDINKMINRVGNNLLSKNEKGKVRFYVLKSNKVNAFSTNQGMIFITTGLLARLSSEAELAFILAHEIVHYTEKHVINSAIETEKVITRRKKLKYDAYDENILKLSKYSKTLEFEADELGYLTYLSQGYSPKDAENVFSVLKFSFLPFERAEINLEEITQNLPTNYILDSIKPFNLAESDDSRSTHPNISLRIEKVKQADSSDKGVAYKMLTEDEFQLLVNTCKVEEIKLQLQNSDYVAALYNSICLSERYPEASFFKEDIAKCLYYISKYSNAGALEKIYLEYDEYPGEIARLYYLFQTLSKEQINAITIQYIAENIGSIDSKSAERMLEDLIYELNLYHQEDLSYFSMESEDIHTDSLEYYFHRTCLNNKDTFIRGLLKKQEENWEEIVALKKERQEREDFLNTMSYDMRMKYLKKEEKQQDKLKDKKNKYVPGKVGAKKVVYIDPNYTTIDERKGVKLVGSDIGDLRFTEQLNIASAAAGLPIEIISPKTISSDAVDEYNDVSILNATFKELITHASLDISDRNFVLSNQQELNIIREKYNTDYFAYTGQIIFKVHKKHKALALIMSILFYPTLPFGVNYALTPKYETYYYSMVIDLQNGRFVKADFDQYNLKSTYGRTASLLYNDMFILKSSNP